MTILKVSNNRLRFEQPIVLDTDKKYTLCKPSDVLNTSNFSHRRFKVLYRNSNTNYEKKHTSSNVISGSHGIKPLEKEIQAMFNAAYNSLIAKMETDKKTAIVDPLKKAKRDPVKFRIKKVDNKYVIIFNTPFPLKIINPGNFSKLFKFEQTIKQNTVMQPNLEYVSESIHEIISPLPVVEWHCNIAEYSYTNLEEHPHLHKQEELIHISFIDNFYENSVYKESHKNIMFVPIRKGLREIREIILTPMNANSKELTNLRNITVYLQLKEE